MIGTMWMESKKKETSKTKPRFMGCLVLSFSEIRNKWVEMGIGVR